MVNTKKLTLVVLLFFAYSQMQGQVRFGVKGGMNVSSFNASSDQVYTYDFSNRIAFNAGILIEIPISGLFAVQPELLFSSKGARCKVTNNYTFPATTGYGDVTEITKLTYTPCYIELPIYLKAGFEAGPGKFIAGVGPYVAYGVGGKLKAAVKSISNSVGKGEMDVFKTDKMEMKVTDLYGITKTTEVTPDKGYFKRFDVGLAGFVGYELNLGFFVTAGFQKGLYNIDKSDDEGEKLKNKTFSVSVGYMF